MKNIAKKQETNTGKLNKLQRRKPERSGDDPGLYIYTVDWQVYGVQVCLMIS